MNLDYGFAVSVAGGCATRERVYTSGMKSLLPLTFFAVVGCTHLPTEPGPHDQFFAQLSRMCGRAYEGRIASPLTSADSGFNDKKLIMHVRDCSSDTIRIPFHVGEDRSRTWVVTRTASGLRLKHDHRHQGGEPGVQAQYGGDTVRTGTSNRQEFPADPYSKDLFLRGNTPQSVANIWSMELWGAKLFAYELRRPSRFFRVEFDLTRPVPTPPKPWGSR